MIICICNNVGEEKLVEIIERERPTTIKELQKHVKACDRCTGCRYVIEHMLKRKPLSELFG